MKKDEVAEIVGLCRTIDEMAYQAYGEFARSAKGDDLRKFWLDMSEDERSHIDFWKRVETMADEMPLPPVFDNPEKVKAEMEMIVPKATAILARSREVMGRGDAILTAYRLEFYLLHPAFETLFHLLRELAGPPNPQDEYERHINRLLAMIASRQEDTPEMELLAEALQHLWQENKNLAKQASQDLLTGLLSRRGFLSMATQLGYLAQRQRTTVGVMMLDIDQFKKLNDTHGHPQGDRVLQAIGRIIQSKIRKADLGGRYGGEEFIVLMPDTDEGAVVTIAERIRQAVAGAKPEGIEVTLSIGVASGRLDSDADRELQKLISRADTNLYKAKEKGRNFVWADSMEGEDNKPFPRI
jgi:diguanylate cyclase (GGDEF)-like protein